MATKAMAIELAQYNIRVNTIAPGHVQTRILESRWSQLPEAEAQQYREHLLQTVPLQQFAEPDDIANVMIFLASDASKYMTGETLTIDGGVLLTRAE